MVDTSDSGKPVIVMEGNYTMDGILLCVTDDTHVVLLDGATMPITFLSSNMQELRYNADTGGIELEPEGCILCEVPTAESIH